MFNKRYNKICGEYIMVVKFDTLGAKKTAQIRQQVKKQKVLREAKLQELTRNAVKGMLRKDLFVKVQVLPETCSTVAENVQKLMGKDHFENSIWAPWSKSFRG